MNVIGIGTLSEFSNNHADARGRLSVWLNEAEEADWKRSHDIKQKYASASFLADNIVVFNIFLLKVNYIIKGIQHRVK